MSRPSIRHSKYILKNFSLGNLTTSIDEYLENAFKWGIPAKGAAIIDDIVQRVREGNPDSAKLDSIWLNDPAVYQLLHDGDTDGVINLDSLGIQAMLRTMKPTCFEDIVALCAVYRPAHLTDGTADKLITRKRSKEPVEYLHPKLNPILQKTYGVILYKEQITEIVEKLAGFSSGDAQKFLDELCRTLPEEAFDWPLIFIMECSERNKISGKEAQKIYDLMKSSVRNIFPERISLVYALTAYYCSYLKVNYPAEFKAAWDVVKPGWDKRNTIMKRPTGRIDISKFLSLVLRHKPGVIGITLDKAGWADIAELAEKGSRAAGFKLSPDRIRKVAAASDKQRFAVSDDGLRIRANQGHSLPLDLGFMSVKPPELLFHGTSTNRLSSIRVQGIVPGNRQYVHLSPDKDTAEAVGSRHGKPFVLTVQADRMCLDGFKFFVSENGVWLTDHVPMEYITDHKII